MADLSALTKAQRRFLTSIKPHVNYRTVAPFHRTAKTLEQAGYVTISGNGLFAQITEAGRRALQAQGGGE